MLSTYNLDTANPSDLALVAWHPRSTWTSPPPRHSLSPHPTQRFLSLHAAIIIHEGAPARVISSFSSLTRRARAEPLLFYISSISRPSRVCASKWFVSTPHFGPLSYVVPGARVQPTPWTDLACGICLLGSTNNFAGSCGLRCASSPTYTGCWNSVSCSPIDMSSSPANFTGLLLFGRTGNRRPRTRAS